MRTTQVALAGLFAALTAVGAQVSIPIGPVPITLQTFFILLSGMIGGAVIGFLSQLIYVLLGAIGLPVFAGFRGGVVAILGPTGGYIISFPLAALASGFFFHKIQGNIIVKGIVAVIAAELIIYSIGVPRLAVWIALARQVSGVEALSLAMQLGMLPFLPGDAIKAAVAIYVATRRNIRTIIERIRV